VSVHIEVATISFPINEICILGGVKMKTGGFNYRSQFPLIKTPIGRKIKTFIANID